MYIWGKESPRKLIKQMINISPEIATKKTYCQYIYRISNNNITFIYNTSWTMLAWGPSYPKPRFIV